MRAAEDNALTSRPICPVSKTLKTLAREDMQAVDALIRRSLQSDVLLVSQVAEYIVTSGGKRLRPLIVLLAARALGYNGWASDECRRHYRIHSHCNLATR